METPNMQISSTHVGQSMMVIAHQDVLVEDVSSFTLVDLLDSVRQGKYVMSQVTDTIECMKKVLAILELHALRNKSEGSEDDLEEYLEKPVENATGKAILTVLAGTRNNTNQGSELPQISDLVKEMSNLNIKGDAALEFSTLIRSDMIQDFSGIERDEHKRESKTCKAVQKLNEII